MPLPRDKLRIVLSLLRVKKLNRPGSSLIGGLMGRNIYMSCVCATHLSTAIRRFTAAANRPGQRWHWRLRSSAEHLSRIRSGCFRLWQPLVRPHTVPGPSETRELFRLLHAASLNREFRAGSRCFQARAGSPGSAAPMYRTTPRHAPTMVLRPQNLTWLSYFLCLCVVPLPLCCSRRRGIWSSRRYRVPRRVRGRRTVGVGGSVVRRRAATHHPDVATATVVDHTHRWLLPAVPQVAFATVIPPHLSSQSPGKGW
eukprot:COSAG05_NODE_431_length_9867_cov_26.467342_1_plen_255_part_00